MYLVHCQNNGAQLNSVFTLLTVAFSFTTYCCSLLLNCEVLSAFISGLQVNTRKKEKKRNSVFYIISSFSQTLEKASYPGSLTTA